MVEKKPSIAKNFAIGGSAGMFSTCCIQPMDYLKVQCQIQGEGKKGAKPNPLHIAKQTIKEYGFKRLYAGLDSALLRQATYTTARMGIYRTLMDKAGSSHSEGVPLWLKCIFSLTAGGIGATIGNPCDLALVRMQADHTLPEAQRRNYTGVFNAISRIIKEEGVISLWKGCTPTVYRAMALNLGMLAPYDQTKELLTKYIGDFNGIRPTCSFIAAFIACVLSMPFDNVKTKYQRMAQLPDGSWPYKSFFDCFGKTFKQEGFRGYYVGFGTYVFRAGPHALLTLLITDFLNSIFNKPS